MAQAGGTAGGDNLITRSGADEVGGDAAAFGGGATATVNNTAIIGGGQAKAGNDRIRSGNSNDTVSGGALAAGVAAVAGIVNDALARFGNAFSGKAQAGNDDINSGNGADVVAGDALATGAGSTATAENKARVESAGEAEAGNDKIVTDADDLGDVVAGDAATTDLAGGNATVTNSATVADGNTGTASAGKTTSPPAMAMTPSPAGRWPPGPGPRPRPTTRPRLVRRALLKPATTISTPVTVPTRWRATPWRPVTAATLKPTTRAVKIAAGQSRLELFDLAPQRPTATLAVRSDPPGLSVWVDGRDTGRVTPATVRELDIGDRLVVLRNADGSMVHRVEVRLEDASTEELVVDTGKLPPLLDVRSIPSRAEVFVGGEARGRTPVTIAGLEPGRARVRVTYPGCAAFSRRIRFKRATIRELDVKLVCGPSVTSIAPGEMGRLNVTASVVADVYVDGLKIGRTPGIGLAIPRGRRTVRLVPVAASARPYETELYIEDEPAVIDHHF